MPDDEYEYLDDEFYDDPDDLYNKGLTGPNLPNFGGLSSPRKKKQKDTDEDSDKKDDSDEKNDSNKKDDSDDKDNSDKKDSDDDNDKKNDSNKKDDSDKKNESGDNLRNSNLPNHHSSPNINGNNNDNNNLDFNRFRRNSPVNSRINDSDNNKEDSSKDGAKTTNNDKEKKGIKEKNTKDDGEDKKSSGKSHLPNFSKNKKNNISDEEEKDDTTGADLVDSLVHGVVSVVVKHVSFILAPILLIIVVIIVVVVAATTSSADTTQINDMVLRVNDASYVSELSDNDDSIFIERLRRISSSYSSNGKNVNAAIVTSVFLVITSENDDIKFNDFTEEQITAVVDAMFVNNSYDEGEFRVKLESILKSYFPNYSSSDITNLVDQIFEIYEDYKEMYPESNNFVNVCAVAGSCSYKMDGITNGSKNISKNVNISNLKVRLMQGGNFSGHTCGGQWGLALPNEELVDFEKYVLGVAYAEAGGSSYEALKAQVIAARSYSLGRADFVGNSNGRKLYQENGQWILQITNCVSDQVYCDPDKGCSKNVEPSNQWGNVHTGLNNSITYKPPLAENAPLRQAAMEVNGEVLIDSKGYIIYTPFTNTNQTRWNSMANSGSDYKQILLSDYSSLGASDIKKMTCNTDGAGCNEAVGDYATWLQSGQTWSSIRLGTSSYTISSAGCLVTSISMLIAKSGVPTTVQGQFNPGTFVEKMNSVGGIDASGNFQWYKVSEAAPNFQFVNRISVIGKSRDEKLKDIKDLIDQGYYVVVEVMGNTGQHWVAIDSVNGDHIFMYDPATQYTDLWSRYNYNNTSAIAYFKVSG